MKNKLSYFFISLTVLLIGIIFLADRVEAESGSSDTWSVGTNNLSVDSMTALDQLMTQPISNYRYDSSIGKAGVQITKYDTKTKKRLQGAQFTIYDKFNRAVQVIETNAYGVAQTNSLPLGFYKVRETRAPVGYLLESSAKSFQLLCSGQIVCITKCNDPIPDTKGTLIIVKQNENNVRLGGAVFNVYNQYNQLVGQVTTDVNGLAVLDNLPYGTYKLIEVQAPFGYELDATPKYVTISPGVTNGISTPGVTKGMTTIFITNKSKVGSLQVAKQDEQGKLLSGAYFQVYNAKNELVTTIVTNANGIAVLGNLPYDTYKLVEVQAPAGYELNQTPYYVTVSKENPAGLATITIINKKKVTTGALEVIKTDESGKRLADAEFEVRNAANQVVGKVTTDSNGAGRINELPFGTYQVTETKAPTGYTLDQTPHPVTLTKDDLNGVATLTVVNQLIKTTGTIEVVKKGEDGTVLAGAVFDVYNANDQKVGTITTNNAGIGSLQDLPFGSYKLIEEQAPVGYELDTTPHYVTLSSENIDGKVSIEVTNKKVIVPDTGTLKIIKYVKDSNPTVYLQGAVFEVYNGQNQLLDTYTTNEQGEIVLPDLAAGKYSVVEIKAPSGYEEDTTFYEVMVEAGKVAEIRHANVKKEDLGTLKIKKFIKDKDGFETTTPLAGATFQVIDSQGATHEATTDTNGEILLTNLPVGQSTVKEISPPEGYELDATPQAVAIVAGESAEVVFYNQEKQQQGRALIYVSTKRLDQSIKGIDFVITSKGKTVFEKTVTTNMFGQISVYLPVGEYEITPLVQSSDKTVKPANRFQIEANKFTVVNIEL